MLTSVPTMVDLQPQPGGDLALSWADAPGACDRTIPAAEITHLQRLADVLSLAEERGRSAATVEARTAFRAGLFALLDGPEHDLAERLNVAGIEQRRFNLVVRALAADGDELGADGAALGGHPATWMRWELLSAAAGGHGGAPLITVVLQLGAADLGPPRVLDHGGLRILFMAFSPHNVAPELDFEHEEETLLSALAPLAEQRRARMRVVEEGTLDDLRTVLMTERFDVVHLSGHGRITPAGPRLVMEDAFGAGRLVSPAELIDVLGRAQAMPQLVMLSTCHSAEVRGSAASFAAELVAAGVPNVLGWTRPVRDDQATLAASTVYEQLGAGATPVEAAEVARERMRRSEERSPAPTHAWSTLHLVSSAAGGFRVDEGAEPLDDHGDRDEVYTYLRGRMRVLERGFVGRRRLVQRLLRVVLRGQEVRPGPEGTREVAGACVFGMRGVGKSCAVGRVIERATQVVPELRVVVILHGVVHEQSMHGAFQEAIATSGGDVAAERFLARTDESVVRRVRRVMELWRERDVIIVLDDFEQNLERRSDGVWRVTAEAAALLEAILPVCSAGKPKVLITSTAEFQVPSSTGQGEEDEKAFALAFVPLGSFDAAAVQKLWMRGQASNELVCVSLRSWQSLAERLGRNARILGWARGLCAGKADGEMVEVAARATAALPVWGPGDEASEEKQAELARLFLQHMAYADARAAFGEDALLFVKRARVFEAAVPREAFTAMVEGLAVKLEGDLDALASWGLLEVGEMDGERAYRVSPLVEPTFDLPDAARWHEAAAAAWEELAHRAGFFFVRTKAAWEHALQAGNIEQADGLARQIDNMLYRAGLHAANLRLAEVHVNMLPASPYGYRWAGRATITVGQHGPRAADLSRHGLALLVDARGTEEHPDVAQSWSVLGAVLREQGDLSGARHALERSLAIWTRVLGTDEHFDVSISLHELGQVLEMLGDLDGARRALERSIAIKARVLGVEENPEVAVSWGTLGRVLYSQMDHAGARRALERSLAIYTKVHGTEEHPAVAVVLGSLGHVLMDQGDLAGARRTFERSLNIKVNALGTEQHPSIALGWSNLGQVLHAQGDLAGARQALEKALAIQVRVFGTDEHYNVAGSLAGLGCVLQAQGDLAGARNALERSLAIKAKVLGTEEHREVAASLYALGCVFEVQGDLAGARKAIERALAIDAKVLGTEEHLDAAVSLHALGRVLNAQGDLAGARKAFERSLAIKAKVLSTEEHPDVAASLYALGCVLEAQGDLAGARKAFERSLAIKVKVLGTDEHPDVATGLRRLGLVLMLQGELAGARRAIERSLAIRARVLGTEEHPGVAALLSELGTVLFGLRDLDGARKAIERSLAIKARLHGTDEDHDIAASLHSLGGVLCVQGDLASARKAFERALAIEAKVFGTEEHPSVATMLASLATVLEMEGRLEPAVASYRRALDIRDRCFGTRDQAMSADIEASLALLLFRLGQEEEGNALLQHALPVLAVQAPNHRLLKELRLPAQDSNGAPAPALELDHPCPCGSSKPFAACHGRPDNE